MIATSRTQPDVHFGTYPAKVVVTHPTPSPAVELFGARGYDVVVGGEADDALRIVAGAHGVLAHLRDPVDDAFLDAAGPQLRVVANFAVGYDNVDLAACARRGVAVTNTPDVLTRAVAEHTFALVLAVARRVVEADRFFRAGRYTGWGLSPLYGIELGGRTLGVVGAGRTGLAVARIAEHGLGMRVVTSRPAPLDYLLREADVVSLHVPLNERTRHSIGARELGLMKPTALLVNVSRGPIVDEAALVEALRTGEIAGAGLDVYEREPEPAPGLVELDNVVLTPHIASATVEARAGMARLAAENVIAVLEGQPPLTPVT